MAPQRILAEMIRRPTPHGDSFYVGHAEHARLTLHFLEVRLGDDGTPVEVWQLSVEATQHHPANETAPPAHRRANALPGHQRPAAGSRNGQRPVSGGP